MAALLAAGLSLAVVGPATADDDDDDEVERTQVGGYIQFHYNYPVGTGAESRFRVHRARVSLEGRATDRITYEMDVDPRAPDHAGTLRDAFFNIELDDYHTLRLGQQKVKFGYINMRSSSALYTVNRPEYADELARGLNLRDVGVTLMGKRPSGEHRTLEYDLSVVNGAGMNVQRDTNKDKNVSGRVGYRRKGPGTDYRYGLSASRGDIREDPEDPFERFQRIGADLQIYHRRFELFVEGAFGVHKEAGDEENRHGYYATWAGKTSGDWGPVLSYDSINDTENVRVALGFYHGKPDADFRVLVNYEFRGAADEGRAYIWTVVRM
jgi:hypothetical protein